MPAFRLRLPIVPDLAAGGAVALAALALMPSDRALIELPTALAATIGVYFAIALMIAWTWPAEHRDFGWPNRVTLLRAGLVAALAGGLMLPSAIAGNGLTLAAVAGVALVLDGLDGWLARKLDRSSRFGARFDMEIDALLILVLSAAVIAAGKVGPWVLAIGLMRYVFIAAGWWWPKLSAELRPSLVRKIICVVQGVVLVVCLLPIVSPAAATALAALSLAALSFSFARDALELARRPTQQGGSP